MFAIFVFRPYHIKCNKWEDRKQDVEHIMWCKQKLRDALQANMWKVQLSRSRLVLGRSRKRKQIIFHHFRKIGVVLFLILFLAVLDCL